MCDRHVPPVNKLVLLVSVIYLNTQSWPFALSGGNTISYRFFIILWTHTYSILEKIIWIIRFILSHCKLFLSILLFSVPFVNLQENNFNMFHVLLWPTLLLVFIAYPTIFPLFCESWVRVCTTTQAQAYTVTRACTLYHCACALQTRLPLSFFRLYTDTKSEAGHETCSSSWLCDRNIWMFFFQLFLPDIISNAREIKRCLHMVCQDIRMCSYIPTW